MYAGEGEEFDLNEEDQKLNHPHWVQDKDEEGFWDDILAYLQERIARNAHDEAGHRGRDLTYQKIHDSYWWPNQYVSVATYCQSCHECQMRLTY